MATILFYILGCTALAATLLCITRRNPVHAIIYLVNALFALALLFYLLGAPLVAAWEVIIYAGAIMVLFLFVIMMLELGRPEKLAIPRFSDWWPATLLMAVVIGSVVVIAAVSQPAPPAGFAGITVREFAGTLFLRYGVAVEVISMQLLFALVGALYLGRRR
jgi:NADH-quinone oxidoreductase subunit J